MDIDTIVLQYDLRKQCKDACLNGINLFASEDGWTASDYMSGVQQPQRVWSTMKNLRSAFLAFPASDERSYTTAFPTCTYSRLEWFRSAIYMPCVPSPPAPLPANLTRSEEKCHISSDRVSTVPSYNSLDQIVFFCMLIDSNANDLPKIHTKSTVQWKLC